MSSLDERNNHPMNADLPFPRGVIALTLACAAIVLTGCATPKARLNENAGFYASLAFSPDGRSLAAADSSRQSAVVFDLDSRVESWRFRPLGKPKPEQAVSVAYASDGHLLAAFTTKAEVVLWDATRSNVVRRLPRLKPPWFFRLSLDARWLALSGKRQCAAGGT